MYDPRNLGRLIRRHREAARLTQEELGKKSGVPFKKISRMEQGFIQDPGFGDVVPVVIALGLTPNETAQRLGMMKQVAELDDERWDWIQSFLGRANKGEREAFLNLAYSAALTAERLGAAEPKRIRGDSTRSPR